MNPAAAIEVQGVSHHYGARQALDRLSLAIEPGEIYALLGPNGGGKTTLFRLLSTLLPVQSGQITILGRDVTHEAAAVRHNLGVVFQSPSLDRQLTVRENLVHQGQLYGLRGSDLARRIAEQLERFGLASRAQERCQTLSGGLRRRVELAKALLHEPRVLLLDEPSTGLDPAARRELWDALSGLRARGVCVALTTHLMEEADRADRTAILNQGRLVAEGTPESLRRGVGGDTLTLVCDSPETLAAEVSTALGLSARVVDGSVRIEIAQGHAWISRLVESFPGRLRSVTLAEPTLEDVFLAKTGHRFASQSAEEVQHV